MQDARVRPFLKWAGGKYRLIDKLLPHLKGKRLIEPFVGAGAVFLNLNFDSYLLGDVNPDLISVFKLIKKEKLHFIRYVNELFTPENNSKESYINFRIEFNSIASGRRRAALFMYLNRHCFNGLCRYNKSGGFNVPFGRYEAPCIPINSVLNFIQMSEKSEFVCEDFQTMMDKAIEGDVVYCDPPYVPLSGTAHFTAYSSGDFNYQNQLSLTKKAKELVSRGIKVVISNHDTELTREMYAGAKIESFPVQRHISRDAKNRKKAMELIAVFE